MCFKENRLLEVFKCLPINQIRIKYISLDLITDVPKSMINNENFRQGLVGLPPPAAENQAYDALFKLDK